MDGGMNCVKYLMFFFNLLIFLAGATLLGAGIWFVVSADTFRTAISTELISASSVNSVYVIIAVGAALFLIGFLGCCGAVNENRCLLGTFFALVLILFIVQIVGAVLVIVYRPEVEKAALDSITKYKNTNDSTVLDGWNEFQDAFKCCGLNGPADWESNIPQSCYSGTQLYSEGCKAALSQMFWIVAGVALGILVIELLAMIFSCCLYRSISASKDYA